MQSVKNLLALSASANSGGPVIGQNVITTTCVFQKPINQSSTLTNDPESLTVSLDKDYTISIERPQKRHCSASSVVATQPRESRSRPHRGKPNSAGGNKYVAPALVETELFDDVFTLRV